MAASLKASLRVCERAGRQVSRRARSGDTAADRVRVRGPSNVFARGAVLEGQNRLGDHLARVRTDDVHAENAIRLGIGQDLDRAVLVVVLPERSPPVGAARPLGARNEPCARASWLRTGSCQRCT